jgi:hypothetical protein
VSVPILRTMRARAWSALVALPFASVCVATPPTPAELAKLCANAEDQAHCGRLVEARRLAGLKSIVTREGDELRIELLPAGSTVFRDAVNIIGARTYAVWDYLEDLETLVLFSTDGDRTEFWLVQRRSGGEYRVASEPVLAPGHRRFATADFCAQQCDNELAVWRIDAGGVRKELAWRPREAWRDAAVAWKDADTVAVEYTVAGEERTRALERRTSDAAWTRVR